MGLLGIEIFPYRLFHPLHDVKLPVEQRTKSRH